MKYFSEGMVQMIQKAHAETVNGGNGENNLEILCLNSFIFS